MNSRESFVAWCFGCLAAMFLILAVLAVPSTAFAFDEPPGTEEVFINTCALLCAKPAVCIPTPIVIPVIPPIVIIVCPAIPCAGPICPTACACVPTAAAPTGVVTACGCR